MAPFIGGFVDIYAGYRWNLIVTSILVTVSWLCIVFLADETYAPILLAKKNKHMPRKGPSLGTRYKNAIVTPWKLLFTEPVLAFMSFYLSFLYAVFYALFPVRRFWQAEETSADCDMQVFPIIYIQIRGFSPVGLALTYISLSLGFACGGLVILFGCDYTYSKAARRMPPGKRPPPETRFAMLYLFNWAVPACVVLLKPRYSD